ncbi:MAG: serine hydrolase domain-containing protein [Anaerovoracaceae bacterium]|jgi:CubicO group peptidase (beta-lactamase class C family)
MLSNVNFAELDAYLEKALYYYDLPGLAVHVGIGDRDYYSSLGWQNALTKSPLKRHHIFHMASVTKLFVSTAILQLWEKGLLNPDERLIVYLPQFRMADDRYRRITLRQLLSHTSGMPDVKDYHWESPETDEGALLRYVLSEEVREGRLLFDPEEGKFAYSNIGYEILGAVIAAVSGTSFEDYVSENIFSPLGMAHSELLTFRRSMDDVCAPHEKTEDNRFAIVKHFPYNRAHGPSSTLTSNLEDMAIWAKAVLRQKILKPATFEEAWREHSIVPNNGERIGLSWFRREQKGYFLFGHEGNDDGFRASFWVCPELDVSVTVCSNISGAPVKRINREVFDRLFTDSMQSE